MVPANFSFDFQGQCQRSKVTALERMGLCLDFGRYSVNRRCKPGNIEIRYLRAVCK